MSLTTEILFIFALILANGFFAAAEIAILTARRSRLERLAESGNRAARLALELARDPSRFLPTVQIGVTVVSTLAATFGGARIVTWLSAILAASPLPLVAQHRETIALLVVAMAISYFSLLFGELVPKRLALASAERFARFVAVPLYQLARVARPVVWIMGTTTEGIIRVLGRQRTPETAVSVEDIEYLIKRGARAGVLEPAEQRVARRALRLGDRTVREVMRPRIDIDALDVNTPPDEVIGAVAMAGFSRLPVHEGDLDHIIGFVYTKDLLRQQHLGWPMNLRKLVRPALMVPETMRIDKLLELFRQKRTQMAIVLDEYGGTEGLVTLEDVLEELVGEIHDEYHLDREQEIVQRDPTSWLVDGVVNLDDLLERMGRPELRSIEQRDFSTVAGLILSKLGRIPKPGERLVWHDLNLEVVDMDGPRIDRVLVTVPPRHEPELR
jgi:putative hemolysin